MSHFVSKNTRISIALCTYNGERFLPDQLESYLEQTRLPNELIICDDASGDETPRILENFAKRAPFEVRLHRNEKNLGSTKNFEEAIRLCTGDLIFLSDQDDVWMREKLQRIEAEFSNQNAGLVFSNARLADEDLRPINQNLWDLTFPEISRREALAGGFLRLLLSYDVITGATMAFQKDCRQYFMPIPDNIPSLIHDGWISILISSRAKIAFVDEPLIIYRQHAGQQLGLASGLRSEAKTYEERTERYAESIKFLQKQIVRLRSLKNAAPGSPGLARIFNEISLEELIAEKKEKMAHYAARRDLPYHRWKRAVPIVNEISSGRYRRFSKGILSPAKDLLQK